jgi:hypothetical protein
VGLGEVLPIDTSWQGMCEVGPTPGTFDAPYSQPQVCEEQFYTVHYTCDRPCARAPVLDDVAPDGDVVAAEVGPLSVVVELRSGDRRHEHALYFSVVDPDPGSLDVSCTMDTGTTVGCWSPLAERVHIWASHECQEYKVQRIVVDGRPTVVTDGLPIERGRMSLQLGRERLELEDPSSYPDRLQRARITCPIQNR